VRSLGSHIHKILSIHSKNPKWVQGVVVLTIRHRKSRAFQICIHFYCAIIEVSFTELKFIKAFQWIPWSKIIWKSETHSGSNSNRRAVLGSLVIYNYQDVGAIVWRRRHAQIALANEHKWPGAPTQITSNSTRAGARRRTGERCVGHLAQAFWRKETFKKKNCLSPPLVPWLKSIFVWKWMFWGCFEGVLRGSSWSVIWGAFPTQSLSL